MAHTDMIAHTKRQEKIFPWGVHSMKKTLDIRSSKGTAGEKKFSTPLAFHHIGYYWCDMGNDQKYSRITITLPPDLAQWLKQKQSELESRDRRLTTSVSAIVADAVAEMKAREESDDLNLRATMLNDPTPAPPHTGASARIVVPESDHSVGGSSTRKTIQYPKVKRPK